MRLSTEKEMFLSNKKNKPMLVYLVYDTITFIL